MSQPLYGEEQDPNFNRVKFNSAVVEPCDAEFARCLLKECITSHRAKEVKSLSEFKYFKGLLEHGKAMRVECYFNK